MTGLHTLAGAFRLGPIDLVVPPDRVLVVLGTSGAGKTLLLDTIAGFRAPAAGRVHLAGADLTGLPPEQRRIGLVFQHAALFPHLTVRDNVRFGLRARGDRDLVQVDDLLDRFALGHLAHRRPTSLSGGERQRVALTRALVTRPALLLLDEPLSALDQPTREELGAVLHDALRTLGIPAVHVTHDRDEALRLADDLAILAAGTLRQTGPAQHVADHPTDPVSARLLGWTELGTGHLRDGAVQLGELTITHSDTPTTTGAVTVFYRAEDVLLSPDHTAGEIALRCHARITSIVPTLPLHRVQLATTPPLTALVLHRHLTHHRPRPGDTRTALIPTDAIRLLPA